VSDETFRFDAFVSYAARPDYATARRVEAFLESFRSRLGAGEARVRQIEICRDGSDFRLPARPPGGEMTESIWTIIAEELEKSRYLLVLCSPEATQSEWVAKEIAWFLEHRGPQSILLAVTHGADPIGAPERCFPAAIRATGLHTSQIWYDLRRLERGYAGQARDAEDELVRLARDLLGWNDETSGPLGALWLREETRRRRRSMRWTIGAAAALSALAIFATVEAWQSKTASQRARGNAIVATADAVPDPLAGVLMLDELAGEEEPPDGMRVAQRLAATPIPEALLRGHTGNVTAAAFLPDGAVVTGSADGTTRIQRRDGRDRALVLASGAVTALAIDPLRMRIATAAESGLVSLWSRQGQRLAHASAKVEVKSMAFSADGEWLALIDRDGGASLWRFAAKELIAMNLPKRVDRVWLAPDGPRGFVATTDGAVYALALDTRSLVPRLAAFDPTFESLPSSTLGVSGFSRDGAWVATLFSNELYLRSTRADGGRLLLKHPDLVTSFAFSPDGAWLVTASLDGAARVWDAACGDLLHQYAPANVQQIINMTGSKREITPERSPMNLIACAPSERLVAMFGDDEVLRLWHPEADGPPRELRGQLGVGAMAFDGDGRYLIAGTDHGTTAVWALPERIDPIPLLHPKPIRAAALSPDGKRVVTTDDDGTVRLWTGGSAVVLPGPKAHACAFSPDGAIVAAAYDDGFVRLWRGRDPPTLLGRKGAPLKGVFFSPDGAAVFAWSEHAIAKRRLDGSGEMSFPVGASKLWSAVLSADGKRLLTTHDDGVCEVWDATTARQIAELRGHKKVVYAGVLDADGALAATVSGDGTARIWNVADPESPIVIDAFRKDGGFGACAISPNGKRIALGTDAGRVVIVDRRGRVVMSLRSTGELAHVGVVVSIAFSPDGRRLLTASGVDGFARLWDLDGRRKAARFQHGGALCAATFSADGARILTAAEDGLAYVWRTNWSDLVRASAARTTATLDVDQRMILLGESEADARRNYERAERRQGREPLPRGWTFTYPSF
jgi:WD40 repeat protein